MIILDVSGIGFNAVQNGWATNPDVVNFPVDIDEFGRNLSLARERRRESASSADSPSLISGASGSPRCGGIAGAGARVLLEKKIPHEFVGCLLFHQWQNSSLR